MYCLLFNAGFVLAHESVKCTAESTFSGEKGSRVCCQCRIAARLGCGMKIACFKRSAALSDSFFMHIRIVQGEYGSIVYSVTVVLCTRTETFGQFMTSVWPLNCASKSFPPY